MFSAEFFIGNRRSLYGQLQPRSFLVLAANGQMQREFDTAYPFEQESNFWYLTGIEERDWWLIVDLDLDKEYLVVPQRREELVVFDGALTADAAQQASGISEVLDHRAGLKLLDNLLTSKQTAYYLKPQPRRFYDFYTNRAQYDLARRLKGLPLEDVRLLLTKLRAIKQPVELAAMQRAIDITIAGIRAVVEQLPQLGYEYEAEALLTYEFRRRGAAGHAFDPILASGRNACTLHYYANNQPLEAGQLLLMDVGARVEHYRADLTRTVPTSQATDRQLAVLEAVRRIHDAAVERCQPGKQLKDYLQEVDQLVGEQLLQLGLVGRPDDVPGIRRWMPHLISHGLGLEVHDKLGQPEALQPGMVITVEPGIYIPDEGIGVRLEDDVLISPDGPVVLSGVLSPVLSVKSGG